MIKDIDATVNEVSYPQLNGLLALVRFLAAFRDTYEFKVARP